MNSLSPQHEDLFFFFFFFFFFSFFFIISHRRGMATDLPEIASPESSSCSAGQ